MKQDHGIESIRENSHRLFTTKLSRLCISHTDNLYLHLNSLRFERDRFSINKSSKNGSNKTIN